MSYDASRDAPVDAIVGNLLTSASSKGRGWVLDLAKEQDKLVVEMKESTPPHDEYVEPAKRRGHQILDAASLVAYAQRYGSAERSFITIDENEAVLILDELIDRGHRERISMPLELSETLRDWQEILEQEEIDHRTLLRFLMAHESDLIDAKALQSMQSVRVNSQIDAESDIRDDGNSIGVVVRTNAGEDLKKFPKRFDIIVPILDQDVGDPEAPASNITIRLDVLIPHDARDGVRFGLHAPGLRAEIRARILKLKADIQQALTGWSVVYGKHQEVAGVRGYAEEDD